MVNLFTKKVATIWGIGFTLGFLLVFLICEQLSHRLRKGDASRASRAVQRKGDRCSDAGVAGLDASPADPGGASAIRRACACSTRLLHDVDTNKQDIVVITCKVLPPMTQGITPQELTRGRQRSRGADARGESGGRSRQAGLSAGDSDEQSALRHRHRRPGFGRREVVLGASEKSGSDVQLEQFAMAWGMAIAEGATSPSLTIRIVGEGDTVSYEL